MGKFRRTLAVILVLPNLFFSLPHWIGLIKPFPTNMPKYDPGSSEETLFNVIIYCPLHLQSNMQTLFTLKRTRVYFLATRDSLQHLQSYWKLNIIPNL